MKWLLVLVLACRVSDVLAGELPRSTPEEQGVSSAELLEFFNAAEKKFDSLHSIMLLRHGHVITEGWWAPYRRDLPHALYSLSKSFTSTGVGLAIAEGKLNLHDPVSQFFADELPVEQSDNLKRMRVIDLLRMTTGHQTEPPRTKDINWAKAFLAHPVVFKPGTHFLYNTPATYMQSVIVQRVTGTSLVDYLKPRLFDPLEIQSPLWDVSPQGMSIGGYGLNLKTEDIARFGQLYLQKGKWNGQQLIPESWVREATSRQTSTGSDPKHNWEHGYGYQFWRCGFDGFRGDGAFGQFCIVMPELDCVLAITSGVQDLMAVPNFVWEKLLPAIKPAALPAAQDSSATLARRMQDLQLPVVDGSATPARLLGRKYVFPPNPEKVEAVCLEAGEQSGDVVLWMRVNQVEHRIVCSHQKWQSQQSRWGLWGEWDWGTPREMNIAACAGMIADDTFAAKVCFCELPFTVDLRLKFSDDEITYQAKSNLGSRSTSSAPIPGLTTALRQAAAQESPANGVAHDFAKWEKAIAAFEAIDREKPVAKNGILFVGASNIALWKSLNEEFPQHHVINRGFGGSEIVDATHFADRMIFPYKPRQIFIRSGGNEIHRGRLPSEVAADFEEFVQTVHRRLPKTEIYFIAISPAPARWGEKDKLQKVNELVRKLALQLPRVGFVDDSQITIDPAGQPRKELFIDDMLHLNATGYQLMADCIRPFLSPAK